MLNRISEAARPRRSKGELRRKRREQQATLRAKSRKRLTGMLARAVTRHRRIRDAYKGGVLFLHDDWMRLIAWQTAWEDYLRNMRSKLYGKTSGQGYAQRPNR